MVKTVKKIGIVAFWLIIWQIAAIFVHNDVLLVGPVETAAALLRLMPEAGFWHAVLGSTANILLGLLLGSLLGLCLAASAYRFTAARELLAPLIGAVKAVPVASFVILALIWSGSGRLSLIVSLTVVTPIVYLSTLEGLSATDGKLIELAGVYRMGALARIRGIYLPQLRPYLISSAELSVGMAVKSAVAAEVIGQPLASLGNELYRAKIYLETDKVLAVTVAAVFLSWLIGRAAVALIKAAVRS